MGARSASPGGALLRSSRMFSIPKPLAEPPSLTLHIGEYKSNTMTRQYPQYQSITSPLASREKGDWGFKRPFPLKSTMATSTPLIRVKRVDTVENITDFSSAADHTLSLEKFQELRVAMTVPKDKEQGASRASHGHKSVFEEHSDVTDHQDGQGHAHRWKFRGPWLARMTEGDFGEYLMSRVRPRRAEFRAMLKRNLAQDMTTRQNSRAKEEGKQAPPPVETRHISEDELTSYLRTLRNDRVALYSIISKFLDLAPLGKPVGFMQTFWSKMDKGEAESPYGKAGPPPSHPSAGISYLRTNSFMENHPVYGPQARRTPVPARVVYPRVGGSPAKLGVGGFVANTPEGENEFNVRYGRFNNNSRSLLKGITHLDTTTFGGAKAFVEPDTAHIDPSGKVVLKVRETVAEAQAVAKENKGQSHIYHDGAMSRQIPQEQPTRQMSGTSAESRMGRVADEIMDNAEKPRANERNILGSSQAYGLDLPPKDGPQ